MNIAQESKAEKWLKMGKPYTNLLSIVQAISNNRPVYIKNELKFPPTTRRMTLNRIINEFNKGNICRIILGGHPSGEIK